MMRRRANKLVWFIGVPVIVFGLAHWGMHYMVQKRLDRFILEAAPQANISYRELKTDLRGMIDINGLEVIPTGQPEAIKVGQVSLEGPNALTYMWRHNAIIGNPDALPENLSFNMRGIEMDLTGDLAYALDRKRREAQGVSEQETATCTTTGELPLSLLKALGIKKLSADVAGNYRYREENESLKSNMSFTIKGIKKLSLEAELANVPAYAMQPNRMQIPTISRLELMYKLEPRFGKDMSAYCAQARGISVAEFEEWAANNLIREFTENGVRLGSGLKFAIRDFYTNWGEIELVMSPPTPMNALALLFTPPQKLEETLGMQLIVNNRMITDLSFRVQKDGALFSRKDKKRQPPPPPKPRYKLVYKSVSPGQLEQHINRDVRLQLRNQPERSGVLIAVSRGQASVEQRLNGGKFTAHVPLKDIVAAEARFRVRINPPSTPEKREAQQSATDQAKTAAE